METKFSSKLSTVLVAAGCSVGLGNIWRFPYVAGENGGAAFVLIYFISIILIGLPVMLSEFALGRSTHRSIVGALRALGNKNGLRGRGWAILGYNGTLAAILIMGFYYVVAGWTAHYFAISVTGEISNFTTTAQYHKVFEDFTTNPWKPIIFTWIFIMLNHVIIELGVTKGLERVSKVLMPMLFLILVALSINSLLLPNSMEGIKFFLQPDFSKITTNVVLEAVGQAFFSLSVGLGALIAYGSYIPRESNLRTTALQVTVLDTAVAIIAGLIIFPAAASVGIDPNSGPALVFETLPAIFNTMPFSSLWASIFFLLLIIAALTSTMSLHEVATVYMIEEWGVSRRLGTYITSISMGLLSGAASLSFGLLNGCKIFGMTLFEFMDYATANIMLPLGGLFICIFTGWWIDRKIFEQQMTNFGKLKCSYFNLIYLAIRYLCPLAIFVIFLNCIGLI